MGERRSTSKYLMRCQELFETPIEIENHVSDVGSGYDDAAAVRWAQSLKAHAKVIKAFGNTPFHIKLILADVDFRHHGVVNQEEAARWGLPLPSFGATPGVITFILTGNWLGQHPLSPWIIAHRLSHGMNGFFTRDAMPETFHHFHGFAVRLRALEDEFRAANPGQPVWGFLAKLGTMRSARKNIILNEAEFFHELFAQYLLTGEVRFHMLPGIEGQIGDFKRYLEEMFQDDLESLLGKIVIM